MSIKKKPITTTSTTHNISRKKLFKFLFKSYIKSAYSGISHIPAATSASVINNNQPHHHHHYHRHFNYGNELRREYYNDMNECSNIIKVNKKKQRQQQSTSSNSGTSIILPMKFVHIPKMPANARPGQSVDADDNVANSKMMG